MADSINLFTTNCGYKIAFVILRLFFLLICPIGNCACCESSNLLHSDLLQFLHLPWEGSSQLQMTVELTSHSGQLLQLAIGWRRAWSASVLSSAILIETLLFSLSLTIVYSCSGPSLTQSTVCYCVYCDTVYEPGQVLGLYSNYAYIARFY